MKKTRRFCITQAAQTLAFVLVVAGAGALVFAGCEFMDMLSGNDEPEAEPPAPSPAIFLAFSGDTRDKWDSAIDLIRAGAGQTAPLSLNLGQGGTEAADLAAGDITGGLALDRSTSPAAVVIDGGGRVIDQTGTNGTLDRYGRVTVAGHPLITVGSGVTLTLANITFKGLNPTDDGTNNTEPVIRVDSGGTLIFGDGAVITGNHRTDRLISDCGGGVFVSSGGVFRMNGGEIRDNKVENGGGGVIVGDSTGTGGVFEMSGKAAISGNEAGTDGGGVIVWSGTFTMDGESAIRGNTAAGNGGGVSVANDNTGNFSPTFTMKGGTISGNKTTRRLDDDAWGYLGGGGVFVFIVDTPGIFTKTGGIIYGSKKADGTDEDAGLANITAADIGHAVATSNFVVYTPGYKRDLTAGTSDDMDSRYDAAASGMPGGGWDAYR
jgi:hypothetical protein